MGEQRAVYFFGCDMGGWQNTDTTKGDALAVCRWSDEKVEHIEATAAIKFFPVVANERLDSLVLEALTANAKIVVAIDAALGWPVEFSRLVTGAPNGVEYDTRMFASAIKNPYLYRETERFIKDHVRRSKDPLTAVGDKFGNNSSKAQMLAAWFRTRLINVYRPPFSAWSLDAAQNCDYTIIEVYPDASRQSKTFVSLRWPEYAQLLAEAGQKDIADAKFCAMTAICYAMQVGIIPQQMGYPLVCCPDDGYSTGLKKEIVEVEGWIFAPFEKERGNKKANAN